MPPRKTKYRQILTYDLSSQAQKEAFEEELDIEQEQEYRRVTGNVGTSSLGSARRNRNAFAVRQSPAMMADSSALQDLYELFGQSLQRQVIDGVYHDCGFDFEASMDMLVELSASAQTVQAGQGVGSISDNINSSCRADGGSSALGGGADSGSTAAPILWSRLMRCVS